MSILRFKSVILSITLAIFYCCHDIVMTCLTRPAHHREHGVAHVRSEYLRWLISSHHLHHPYLSPFSSSLPLTVPPTLLHSLPPTLLPSYPPYFLLSPSSLLLPTPPCPLYPASDPSTARPAHHQANDDAEHVQEH